MSLKLTYYEQLINLIHSNHLPWVIVGVGVTIEPLNVDEKFAVRCVLLVRMYGVFDSVFT